MSDLLTFLRNLPEPPEQTTETPPVLHHVPWAPEPSRADLDAFMQALHNRESHRNPVEAAAHPFACQTRSSGWDSDDSDNPSSSRHGTGDLSPASSSDSLFNLFESNDDEAPTDGWRRFFPDCNIL
jgi:hypothetical protein